MIKLGDKIEGRRFSEFGMAFVTGEVTDISDNAYKIKPDARFSNLPKSVTIWKHDLVKVLNKK